MSDTEQLYDTGGNLPQTMNAFKNRACALPFDDPGYQPPSPEEITQLIKLAGWSQAKTAKLVGVNYNPKKGSTTIRKWRTKVDSPEHRNIPYSAWRLLLLYAGVVKLDFTEQSEYKVAE